MGGLSLVVIAIICMANSAQASHESEQLYTKGLVHFHAGRLEDALSLFDVAVTVDPQDTQARYYRGVTRARLNRSAEAIQDLEIAAADPRFPQASLDLGVALVEAGRFQDAVAPLERAKATPNLSAAAAFYLGLAYYRLQDLGRAREQFGLAARDDSLRTAARYYEGLCDYREGNWRGAAERFEDVIASAPESQMAREAKQFLERMGTGKRRRFSVWGETGFQYDSNVTLQPDDDAVQGSQGNQDDGRAIFLIGGSFAPWRSENGQLVLAYELFDSQHFDLTEFNLQDHRASTQLNILTDPMQLGLFARYDYYLSDDDQSFLQEVNALPWVTIPESSLGRLEIFYRQRWRDFKQLDFHPQDGFNYAPGILQVFYLGSSERYVGIGYRFDREDTDDETKDAKSLEYYGHEVSGEVGWVLPANVSASATYAYRNENYDAASDGRDDDEHRIFVGFAKPLGGYFAVALEYFGTINDSTQAEFEYNRHILSLTLRARY